MNGWPAVAVIIVAQIAAAVFLIRGAAMVGLPRDIGFDDRVGQSHGPAHHRRRLEISTDRDLVRWQRRLGPGYLCKRGKRDPAAADRIGDHCLCLQTDQARLANRRQARSPCISRANFPAADTPVIFVSCSVVGSVRSPYVIRGLPR
jgi:hypothetical protein